MVSDFRKKQKNSWLLAAGAILFIGFLTWILLVDLSIYQKKQEFTAKIESLKKQIQDITARNNKLQAGILGANNPDYIEKIARQDLSLQKSGEQVVSFIMSSPSPTPKNDGPVAKPSWFGWLNNLWQAIK